MVKDLKCSNCGAVLKVDDSRSTVFCQYCGHQMKIEEDNKQVIHNIIDENRNINVNERKIIGTTDEVALKKLELERVREIEEREREEKSSKERKKYWLIGLIAWAVSLLVFFIVSLCTLDDVGFSPFWLILIVDLVGGLILIKKKRNK